MIYGLDNFGQKISASPNIKSICPACYSDMIPKCGKIKKWHWAHKKDCQFNYEPETDWHLNWKSLFPKSHTEVIMKKNEITKIADAVLPNGAVIEFQHSPISVDEIEIRESFYERMYWVFDARNARDRFDLKKIKEQEVTFFQKDLEKKIKEYDDKHQFCPVEIYRHGDMATVRFKKKWANENSRSFIWKHGKKILTQCKKPIFLDFGDYMFFLKKFDGRGGYGEIKEISDFKNWIKESFK